MRRSIYRERRFRFFMTANELVKNTVKILDSKKAEELVAIRVKDLTILAEYLIIANGTSNTQVKMLADEVEYQLGEMGIKPHKVEGYQSGNWIVLDYIDVVVHIFLTETREFYSLERLWADGDVLNTETILGEN